MKKMIAFAVALMMLLGCGSAFADTVRMGTNAQFPPFEFIGDDGKPTGFDVEIAQIIAADLGKELEIEDIYFDGLLTALETGSVDFIIAAMTITPEREAMVSFSEPYFDAAQAVVVLEGYEGIKTVEDIADKKVAVQDGTTGFFMASDALGVDASNIAAFKASTDTVMELQAGGADCIIIDNAVAQNFLASFEGLTIVEGLEMETENYGIAMKKDNEELLASINATLEKIKADGTYDALIAKYFEEAIAAE